MVKFYNTFTIKSAAKKLAAQVKNANLTHLHSIVKCIFTPYIMSQINSNSPGARALSNFLLIVQVE